MKSISECIICLFSLSKYSFSTAILIKHLQCPYPCLLAQRKVSNARRIFVFFFFFNSLQILARDWMVEKTLKLHKIQQINLVLFEIHIRKLIISIES